MNKDSWSALTEIKSIKPKKDAVMDVNVSVSSLSEKTRDYIKYANKVYDDDQRNSYAKKKVTAMSEDEKKLYKTAKSMAMSENTDDSFDSESFNIKYNDKFYNEYVCVKASDDELSDAIIKINKLKTRFSVTSRLILTSFIEYIIKQIITHGMHSCVVDKKKIIQLYHSINSVKVINIADLINNLKTFKIANEFVNKSSSTESSVDEKGDAVVKNKTDDIFVLSNVSVENQYQFKYYVADACKEIKQKLSNNDLADEENLYKLINTSTVFKSYCTTLACELLMRIGNMIENEIKVREIRTVNETIIKIVLSHFHIACGVSETDSLQYIKKAIDNHNTNVLNRKNTKTKTTKE